MKTIAFIPARGGSKGLPGKNIRDLNGRPLIAHAIRAARNAELVDEVVVSTEDKRIAEVAAEYGANIHVRAPHYAGDSITSETVIAEWIASIKKENRPDLIVFLQCTAPLMLSRDIEACMEMVQTGSYDACCAAAPFYGILWDSDNLPHGKRLPRQERACKWLEAGSVYVFTLKAFQATHSRFGTKCGMYEIPAVRCIEIDTLLDFHLCEFVLNLSNLYETVEVEHGPFQLGK